MKGHLFGTPDPAARLIRLIRPIRLIRLIRPIRQVPQIGAKHPVRRWEI
ncbi:MAG: hypothetical protein LW720_01595 [Pirellula sp.]|nr:hypothetical protein [Pirellula sp.]